MLYSCEDWYVGKLWASIPKLGMSKMKRDYSAIVWYPVRFPVPTDKRYKIANKRFSPSPVNAASVQVPFEANNANMGSSFIASKILKWVRCNCIHRAIMRNSQRAVLSSTRPNSFTFISSPQGHLMICCHVWKNYSFVFKGDHNFLFS